MSKTNLIVTDLDSLFENLCDVYNSYDKGKLKDNEVTTFTKTAKCMVSVKNQPPRIILAFYLRARYLNTHRFK